MNEKMYIFVYRRLMELVTAARGKLIDDEICERVFDGVISILAETAEIRRQSRAADEEIQAVLNAFVKSVHACQKEGVEL